jgi:hypothetical protein
VGGQLHVVQPGLDGLDGGLDAVVRRLVQSFMTHRGVQVCHTCECTTVQRGKGEFSATSVRVRVMLDARWANDTVLTAERGVLSQRDQ